MKLLIAALLSAGLITIAAPTQASPVNKVDSRISIRAVQAKLPEKEPQATQVPEAKTEIQTASKIAQTDPQTISTTGAVAQSGNEPDVKPQTQVQGCAAYTSLLAQYDWNVSVMAAVMQAESSCNPNAVSPPNWDGLRDYGLMQLHGQEIYDPATNIAHAYSIWQSQGYGAWSTYTSGAYLKYL